jgi:hypothetical protein
MLFEAAQTSAFEVCGTRYPLSFEGDFNFGVAGGRRCAYGSADAPDVQAHA